MASGYPSSYDQMAWLSFLTMLRHTTICITRLGICFRKQRLHMWRSAEECLGFPVTAPTSILGADIAFRYPVGKQAQLIPVTWT
jgi:hypothetical protein